MVIQSLSSMRTVIRNKLYISEQVSIFLDEIDFFAVRSQGPGGQHVNKVNSAIELRFNIASSSLPDALKSRLFAVSDRRLNSSGVIVIKSGIHRSQIRNKDEALNRLADLIRKSAHKPKLRKASRPTKASIRRRLDQKARRSKVKSLRGRPRRNDD